MNNNYVKRDNPLRLRRASPSLTNLLDLYRKAEDSERDGPACQGV